VSQHNLSLNLTRPASSSLAKLIIKQKEYDAVDGILSRAGLHTALFALLNEEEVPDQICTSDCGTTLYVYRYDPSLPYALYVSHGALSERVVEEVYVPLKLAFRMEQEKSLALPCFGIGDYRWLGDKAWNADASLIAPPSISSTINSVSAGQPVYGTLAVAIKVVRDRYSLRLPQRVEAEENKFSSVAYAIHKGGPTWEHIKPPPGAEDTGQQCSGGGGSGPDIEPPDDPYKPPTAPHRDGRQVTDYCTQEVTSVSP